MSAIGDFTGHINLTKTHPKHKEAMDVKKRFLVGTVVFLLLFLLCARLQEPPHIRPVVTRIDICTRHRETVQNYTVSDQQIMGQILTYLRAANKGIPAEKIPETPPENIYAIKVCLANGKCHIYYQLDDTFFRRDNGSWKLLDNDRVKKMKILEKQVLSKDFCQKNNFSTKATW